MLIRSMSIVPPSNTLNRRHNCILARPSQHDICSGPAG